MAKLTKKDLVDKIAENCDMSKADAERVLVELIKEIIAAMTRYDEVTISRFGSFVAQERPAREARNPRTGEVVQVAARRVPKFKAAKALKDAVR